MADSPPIPHAARKHASAASPLVRAGAPASAPRPDLHTPEQAAFDRVLVERVRAGQRHGASREEFDDARVAMGQLVERFQDRVYAVCVRMVGDGGGGGRTGGSGAAQDLAQESLLHVIQGLDSYDGRARLSTWIIRITLNTCLSYLRSTKVRRHASLDLARDAGVAGSLVREAAAGEVRSPSGHEPGGAGELAPDQSVQQEEQRRRLARALANLDPDQRALLVLRDVQGLDYEQMAAALQVPVGTVKSRLFRARLALRDVLLDDSSVY